MLEEWWTQNVWAPRTIYGKLINSRTFTGICGDLVGLCVSRTMYVSKIGSCRMENAPRHVHLRRAGWSKNSEPQRKIFEFFEKPNRFVPVMTSPGRRD